MIAGVIVNRTQEESPIAEKMKRVEHAAVNLVVDAARRLLA